MQDQREKAELSGRREAEAKTAASWQKGSKDKDALGGGRGCGKKLQGEAGRAGIWEVEAAAQ